MAADISQRALILVFHRDCDVSWRLVRRKLPLVSQARGLLSGLCFGSRSVLQCEEIPG